MRNMKIILGLEDKFTQQMILILGNSGVRVEIKNLRWEY